MTLEVCWSVNNPVENPEMSTAQMMTGHHLLSQAAGVDPSDCLRFACATLETGVANYSSR